MGAAPERQDVRVLDEEEGVRDLLALPRGDELLLERPDLAVLPGAEIEDAGGQGGGRCHGRPVYRDP